jgi:CubicO group peptidase (beta-lactamase class C family)
MVNRSLRRIAPFALVLVVTGSRAASDDLDAFITSQLALRHVAGLSLAIIDGGRIIDARAYGYTDAEGGRRVDTTTLFQAGSVSKPVSSFAALRLVEQHKLDLDVDINMVLRSWKLPPSEFTASKPVTLRGLLSHTAGLTVHGFAGYATDAKVPTLVQVLDGTPPANSAPIRNDAVPGAKWTYSGGGYTIMQQMVIDVTGRSFPDVLRENVLTPLGMARSSFEQPLPPRMAAQTAAGHYQNGSIVPGRWHVYPEMAAAGLWTTPSDLARFAIEVERAYTGQSTKVVSQAMAKRMLTVVQNGYGLGLALQDTGTALRFSHNGRDEGFDTDMTATANTGQGVVIMINANDDSRMVARIRDFVAAKYHWPNARTFVPPKAVVLSRERVDEIAGHYEFANNQMIAFVNQAGRLFTMTAGHPDEEYVFVDADHFASTERPARYGVVRDASGRVVGLSLSQGTMTRAISRIGPLFKDMVTQPSPDASLDARVATVLRAVAAGGPSVASVQGVTDGFRHDYGVAPWWPPARGFTSLQYVGAQNVEGRNIERHGAKIARVVYYRMVAGDGPALLLVHLTADGNITDFDVVDG